MRKTQILMNNPFYLGLSILDLSKIVMYEFWYDYVKPKYGDNAKLCYMDTDSFILHVTTKDIFKDIAGIETRFDRDHCLKEKIKKAIELMKDELGGQITKEFVRLRAKTYSYSKDNNDEDKKAKGRKKWARKR